MYKKFFMGIAAMAALTLVSCSSEDLNSLSDNSSKGGAISFDGYLGRSAVAVNGTRGSVIKIDGLKEATGGFGVFGNYSENTPLAYGENLFKNEQVTYSSSNTTSTKWAYKNTKYWPTEGHIDFLAYAPYDSNQKLIGDSKLEFTVNPTITDQKDLLWANAANQTKANNSGTGKNVKFTFNHALSRLGYTVKLKEKYTGATIKLTNITLAGSPNGSEGAFYKTGTIDLSKTPSSTDLWEKPSTSDAKQKFDWFTGEAQTLATTPDYENPKTDYLFVIPQNFSAAESESDKLYVIVEYTIGYNDVTTTITNKVYKQLDNKFEQGKAYTINLTIGLTPIEFDAEVTDWKPADGTPIEIDTWN